MQTLLCCSPGGGCGIKSLGYQTLVTRMGRLDWSSWSSSGVLVLRPRTRKGVSLNYTCYSYTALRVAPSNSLNPRWTACARSFPIRNGSKCAVGTKSNESQAGPALTEAIASGSYAAFTG